MQSVEQEVDKQANEGGAAGGSGGHDKNGGGQGSAFKSSIEEKKQRISHNQILAEHFQNKGKNPHASLQKLLELYEHNQSNQ